MTDILDFNPVRALDNNGASAAGAKAYFFIAGTTTSVAVQQFDGDNHPIPLVADGDGVFPEVFYSEDRALKAVIYAADDTLLYEVASIKRAKAGDQVPSPIGLTASDFGALGNGTSIDTGAIQAMMDHSTSTGEEVYIPAGEYIIDQPLVARTDGSGVKIRGAGMGKTTIRREGFAGQMLRIYDQDGVRLSDMSFDGNFAENPTQDTGIDCRRVNDLKISEIEIYDCGNVGIFLISGTNLIENERCYFDGIYAHDIQYSGIQMQGVRESGMKNCTSERCGLSGSGVGTGVYYKVPASDCYMKDCVSRDCVIGFTVGSSYPDERATRMNFENLRAIDCQTAFRSDNMTFSKADGIWGALSNTNINGIGDGVRLQSNDRFNVFRNVSLSGVAEFRGAARFTENSENNIVEIVSLNATNGDSYLARFETGALNNRVTVPLSYDPVADEVQDLGTNNVVKDIDGTVIS